MQLNITGVVRGYRGHCYGFFPTHSAKWDTARTTCKNQHNLFDLVAIETEHEQTWIKEQGAGLAGWSVI